MAYFPVTNSNLSATHLGIFLQEKYPLKSNTSCRLIRAGINDTYLVTDHDNKYVFRVYSLNWRTRVEITEEIRLLNQLNNEHVSVSYAVPDNDNNYRLCCMNIFVSLGFTPFHRKAVKIAVL